MKLYSWNVNGYRAAYKKGFPQWLAGCGADVVCVQETKARPEQLSEAELNPDGYTGIWNPSKKKQGWSGTACFCRNDPLAKVCGMPSLDHSNEGRLIRLEYPEFHLFNIYFPNGQMSEERLAFKLGYYDAFLEHAQELRRTKPIVVCGDFNTAHTELDLKNPKSNEKHSGFLPVERAWLDAFVAAGYVDTFRMFVTEGGHYTWWDQRFNARERNVGWRIDYFFVSEELRPKVTRAWIEPEVPGSDHCPVGLELDV